MGYRQLLRRSEDGVHFEDGGGGEGMEAEGMWLRKEGKLIAFSRTNIVLPVKVDGWYNKNGGRYD